MQNEVHIFGKERRLLRKTIDPIILSGNDNRSVTKDGREIISIKNSKDIFGNLETKIKSEADPETTAFLMKLLSEADSTLTGSFCS